MKIETILSPSLFHQVTDLESKNVVAIDILRATSTITTIINNGAVSVIPVSSEDEARSYKAKGYLVGGERGGETIPGFDFGNSPFHYHSDIVKGKDVVLTTTNGTKIIEMSKTANNVVVGSFLNLNAVVQFLEKEDKDVVLFCAGWKDRVNLEDSLYAGAIAALLPNVECDDATQFLISAYKASNNLFETLQKSNHFQRLAKKGVIKDIEYCCTLNSIEVVPALKEGKIISI